MKKMGMTIAEKILARHSRNEAVAPGQYVTASIDQVSINDPFPRIHENMESEGIPGGLTSVWDENRVLLAIDHASPAMERNVGSAQNHLKNRALAKKLNLAHFFDVGSGICHQLMIEKGFVIPGSLIVSADSHGTMYGALNCAGTGIGETEMAWVLQYGELWFRVPSTIRIEVRGALPGGVMAKDIFLYLSGTYGSEIAQYKAIEWTGSAAATLSLDGRLCLSAQAVDIGAKFSFFQDDSALWAFLKGRTVKESEPVTADIDAKYESILEVDTSGLQPLVAEPHSLEKVRPATSFENIKIHQAVIGGCTNGRIEDIACAAQILKGTKVHPNVRLLVSPASWEVYKATLAAGYLQVLIDSGAILIHPSCAVCIGGIGVLAPGEVCITATSRNFQGRMGSPHASIYLGSPATVAASAAAGHICDPREVIGRHG